MSKKSGFFYSMCAWLFAMFAGNTVYKDHSSGSSKYQPKASQGGGGTIIRSHGRKPVYYPLHPEEKRKHLGDVEAKRFKYSLQGITWDSVTGKLYWASHQLAVDNQNI